MTHFSPSSKNDGRSNQPWLLLANLPGPLRPMRIRTEPNGGANDVAMMRSASAHRCVLRAGLLAVVALIVPLWGCAVPWQSPVTASLNAPPGEAAELPGEVRDGWVIVDATVNGRGPFRFILDTWANFSAITAAAAAQAGVEPSDAANIVDISGDRRKYSLGWADTVEIGPVSMRRMPLIVTDNLADVKARIGVVGLLGYPGFDEFTLDLDYPAGVARVSDAPLTPDLPGVVRLRRLHDETPEIMIELLDQSGTPTDAQWFAVDSGGSAPLHLPDAMRSWTHQELSAEIGTGRGLSGVDRTNHISPLRGAIRIGPTVIDRAVAETDNHHTLIGHQLLRQFRVRLDPRSGLASFTPADPTQKRLTALQFGGIGVNATIRHDDLLILFAIAADSPAARAGLRPNDQVLAIDGIPVTDPAFVNRTGRMFDPPPQLTLTIQREDEVFDLTVPIMPLFPENLDQLRNARPDLEPPPVQLITRPDGTQEFVFPDGSRGVFTPVPPNPINRP